MNIPHAAIVRPLEQTLPGWAVLPILLAVLLVMLFGMDMYRRLQTLTTLARHERTVRGFRNKGRGLR